MQKIESIGFGGKSIRFDSIEYSIFSSKKQKPEYFLMNSERILIKQNKNIFFHFAWLQYLLAGK